MKFNHVANYILAVLFCLVSVVFFITPGFCAKKQFTPQMTISEEYTDNFYQTKNNKDDEFSTRYKPGFSFGIIDKKNSFFIDYTPEYTDRMDKNEYDAWNHAASMEAILQTAKNTELFFSESFNRGLNRTARTNNFEKHDTNTAMAAVKHQFGRQDFFNLNYTYTFDDYENPNQDEFETHRPSAFLSYWFMPNFGFDLNTSYSKTDYEISSNDPETMRGDLRLLKKINPHLDVYVKYAHSYTDQESGDYVVYNPSLGFDWKPTEDSGIILGGGILIQEYDNQSDYDSEKFFLEFDIYKNFSFSRRNNLSITGSSGYNDIDEQAASLGFAINYQAGFLHTYELTKRLSSKFRGSYRLTEYDEPGVNRNDKTMNLGAGLVWSPLKWLKFDLLYSYIDFQTDSTQRGDYQENMATFSVSFIPSQPALLKTTSSRQYLENEIFNYR